MGRKRSIWGIILFGVILGVFGGYTFSYAYTMTIGMNDDQDGNLNISINLDTNNANAGMVDMTANCCFSSYHPYLEGAMIDGCLTMAYSGDAAGNYFSLTVDGGPVVYTFLDSGSFQVSFDDFTIGFGGDAYAISGIVNVDGASYDLSDWGGDPMWLFF